MSKIQVVWFRDLTRWDTKNYMNQLQSRFPLKPLREFIIENTDKIKPFDFPQQKFDILGVTNKEGVYFNESLLGSQIKQPYYRVNGGDIFYNPYRVNVGSIGIVPQEFDGKFTSPAYVVFHTKKTELLAEYLVFILKSSWFNAHLRANTKGSVRQNLSFESLCELKIPLPPLEIQNKIVADIHAIQAKIKALQDEEKRLKDEIEAYIYIALGLQKPQIAKKQKVFTVRFKDLDRWDIVYNQGKVESDKKFEFETLANLSIYLQRGKTPIYSNVEKYPVIAQKCVQWSGLEINKALFIEPNSINTYTQDRLLQNDDILLNSTGLGTLGRVTIYQKSLNPYSLAVADGHITVIRLDKNKILPKYFYLYFASSNIQNTIEEYATGSTKQKELSLTLIKQIKIPLPPLDIQKDIVAFVEQKTAHISKLAQERTTLQNSIESNLQEMLTN